MARIRALKIGFFKNERLAELTPWHRLLFEGLWLLADKDGRLEDRPKRIKGELFPYDDGLDVSAMLQDLARGPDPFIYRYIIDGAAYIAIRKFAEHQRPHGSEPESLIPEPPEWVTDPGNAQQNRDGGETSPPRHTSSSAQTSSTDGRKQGNGIWVMGNGNGVPPATAEEKPVQPAYTPEDLVGLWNALAEIDPQIARVKQLTPDRRKKARKRLSERSFEEWREVVAKIGASDFCRGLVQARDPDHKPWVASFDWLLKPDSAVKVLEGKYDNRTNPPRNKADPPRGPRVMTPEETEARLFAPFLEREKVAK